MDSAICKITKNPYHFDTDFLYLQISCQYAYNDSISWGKGEPFDVKGKELLITGGTGSFGNAVLKRFLDTEVEEIRIFSRDEKKQVDMRRVYQNDKIQYYIGDVRDLNSIRQAMYDIDYVFHAAALKQVPNCEFFPLEAVKTNVLGTDNVLTAAIDSGVKKVICLSTDKAAYPGQCNGCFKGAYGKSIHCQSKNRIT